MAGDCTYEGVRRVCYGDDGATFVPVCVKCGRFVKADKTMVFQGPNRQPVEPNATCSRCGRTAMLWEGYM